MFLAVVVVEGDVEFVGESVDDGGADAEAGEERKQNSGRTAVHDEIEPLDKLALLILRECGHLMGRVRLRVFDERPVEERDDAELVGMFHRKAKHEDDVVDRLYADTSLAVEPSALMEVEDVRLNIRFGD